MDEENLFFHRIQSPPLSPRRRSASAQEQSISDLICRLLWLIRSVFESKQFPTIAEIFDQSLRMRANLELNFTRQHCNGISINHLTEATYNKNKTAPILELAQIAGNVSLQSC
ncbi:hypothetical protein Mal48_34580 [Thalassoglobus polymorphus]|uniref:Uncharacterized protein n=1 Tax=Thalassoglobus polymorphus TaxID=2527994 RepID=A0A517QRF9_9PLAN|nr:hypothetical protein Mal48_34580 [Thalassoglobus polymorphus]